MVTKMEIKESGLSRKEVAQAIGMKYMRLSNKLCGFSDFTPEEESRIREVLAEAKARRSAA
jgi:transcriptional regulator with XRE-family HTH domain